MRRWGVRAAVVAGLGLAGCEQPAADPLAQDAHAYAAAMVPLVARNMAISARHLDHAQAVNQGTLTADGVMAAYRDDLGPATASLATDAAALTPATPQFQGVHRQVVEAWTGRAEAYAGLVTAWDTEDVAAFDASVAALETASETEGAYFSAVNALLKPYQLWLDPFPAADALDTPEAGK